ncbi:MAG: hypothetical protein LUC24_06855 [Bacteroidales bacterium]|nr:hypothetical protein [Bacteroidales bacterium]
MAAIKIDKDILTPADTCAEWQWSVKLPGVVSEETGAPSEAFLWIPADCERVKAVVIGTHNMDEEPLFENPFFRHDLAKSDVAIIWITPLWDYAWDISSGCQEAFEKMMADLAEVSGYDELAYAPVVPLGHSAMATYPWNFAAWNPERTLAVISYHGDSPRTNLTGYGGANLEWGRTRNIDGIPGLMVEGEFEWWEARVNPALAFRIMYPESCISFLCDAGRGHFDITSRTARYIALFIRKAIEQRMPDIEGITGPVELRKLSPMDGWLAQRWSDSPDRPAAAPYASYKGDPHDAFWYFDSEMANLTEAIYKESIGKKRHYLGFAQNDTLLSYHPENHVSMEAAFEPEADGLTFRLKAVHTDSTRNFLSDKHPSGDPTILRTCGPVEKVSDTTFTVRFYRMGLDNVRRANEIHMVAFQDCDSEYKASVQEVCIHIPYRITEGRTQTIDFPAIPDVTVGTESIELNATSDSGLPVYYYVKYGPAVIHDNELTFTKIPPRSKFPVEVSVVAWQYGIVDRYRTAKPVERTFRIFPQE